MLNGDVVLGDVGNPPIGHLNTGYDFGFYLETTNGTFYSDSLLNGGNDHMLAFEGTGEDTVQIGLFAPGTWGTNEYILAWEDLPFSSAGCDQDYQDFVVMVESVSPVPVPAAVLLGALGLGAAGLRLRKRG
jgi:hypothetical protein